MKIKETPESERPRERLLRHGARVLSDSELLAVLLQTGVAGQSVLELSRTLLKDGWGRLSRRTPAELMAVRGLGQAKVAVLTAAFEVGYRVQREGRIHVRGPEDVVPLVADLRDEDQEHFRVVCLDTKGQVVGCQDLFRGGLDSVEVFPREVFRVAVGYAAASVVVAHNHPSGDPEPSQHDRLLTRRLEEAGEIMGIQVLDHIIVGRARHVSLHRGQRVDIEDT